MSGSIWVVSYNQDCNEWSRAFPDPCLAVIDIARELDCVSALSDGASREFWDEVDFACETGDWKGLSVHQIDLETLETRKLGPEDLVFSGIRIM